METNREVEFIVAWSNYSVGERITPTAGDRDWLIENGFVKEVVTKKKRGPRGQSPHDRQINSPLLTR